MMLGGRTFLVTGATDGIGRHTAERLATANQGAKIIIHGRNPARVKDTHESIAAVSANPSDVYSVVADFADFSDVRNMARQVQQILKTEPLNVLINNAGTFEQQRKITKDGLEQTWQVNVASPYLLTSLLLPYITERIVNVASISASSSIDFDNLQQERGFSSHSAYSLSKLCNIMFSNELAHRITSRGRVVPHVNSLDPGTVNTKMLYAGWGPIGMRIQDANDQYWLATSEELGCLTGRYFVGRRERRPPGPAEDAKARSTLWEILEEQTNAEWI